MSYHLILMIAMAIVGLSAFLHSLRWAQVKNVYIYAMAPFNYATAAAIFIIWTFSSRIPFNLHSLLHGCAVGFCYGTTFFLLLYGMRRAGVAKTTIIVNLAYILPVLASVCIWNERLTSLLIAGIILGLISIPLILWPSTNDRQNGKSKSVIICVLALSGLYFSQGLAYTIMKSFEMLDRPSDKPLMLAGLFSAAAVFTAMIYLLKFQRPTPKDIYHGLITGLCNAISNTALVSALTLGAASIVFPTFTVGTITLVTLASIFLWHERYSFRAWIGLAIACISISLMNL